MDIEKEREVFEKLPAVAELIKTNDVLWSEVHGEYFGSDHELDCWIDGAWAVWQAKAQAVPEWKDYSQQSPRIDGRYQIFISGEQLAADWKSPFGFADPIEGVALIQELITHWAVLSADPMIKAQEQSHE